MPINRLEQQVSDLVRFVVVAQVTFDLVFAQVKQTKWIVNKLV